MTMTPEAAASPASAYSPSSRQTRIDTTAYLRLEASNSLGTSPSGAAFATSTGDILEVACFGPGVFRLRAGPNTKADYGLVIARAERCDVAHPAANTWSFTADSAQL